MKQIDSKLFCGIELGQATEIINKMWDFIERPPINNVDTKNLLNIVEWINTRLPDGVFLEITYPIYGCEQEDMIAHLNLLDNDEDIDVDEMIRILDSINYGGYKKVLRELNMPYKSPVLYTRYYIYGNLSN
jgi:hypothetical protein